MRILPGAILLLALTACTGDESSRYDWEKDPRCLKGGVAEGCVEYFTSMIDLIANAPNYEGRIVQVIGFVNLEPEGNAIYASEGEYTNRVTKSARWLEMQPASPDMFFHLHRCYMIIKGTFSASSAGHMGLFSGVLKDLTRFEPANDPANCQQTMPASMP